MQKNTLSFNPCQSNSKNKIDLLEFSSFKNFFKQGIKEEHFYTVIFQVYLIEKRFFISLNFVKK
jgi:hypothetical protein